jgi:hypothetical protein
MVIGFGQFALHLGLPQLQAAALTAKRPILFLQATVLLLQLLACREQVTEIILGKNRYYSKLDNVYGWRITKESLSLYTHLQDENSTFLQTLGKHLTQRVTYKCTAIR